MKYTVSVAVDGRIDVEVEAENPESAAEEAEEAFMFVNLKKLDVVDWHLVNCSDDKGNIVKDY